MKKTVKNCLSMLAICFLVAGSMPDESQLCLAASKLGPGNYQFVIVHQGVSRKYDVHVPLSYRSFKPMPVVLNFHGGGGGAPQHRVMTGMDKTADQGGFISVYPWGSGKNPDISNGRFWNPGFNYFEGTDNAYLSQVDDIGFVNKILDDLILKFKVDQSRVYAAGLSNGGIFAQRLGCDLDRKSVV